MKRLNIAIIGAGMGGLASAAALSKAGIDVAPVWQAPMVEFVAANGEISYDQTHVARLSSRVPGTVWRVDKQIGEMVLKGEVVALVDAEPRHQLPGDVARRARARCAQACYSMMIIAMA
jgi:cobalt-zinc-cadmium efflux system membrane fusion protein